MLNYLDIPNLVAILAMAVMLTRLPRGRGEDSLQLWIAGLLLIVLEGAAKMMYLMPMSKGWHAAMHVVALDAYFLAGLAFFQSAAGRIRYLKYGTTYLLVCALPHLALQTVYGAGWSTRPLMLGVSIGGLAVCCAGAAILRRPRVYYLVHAAVWLFSISSAWHHNFRTMAYYSLFCVYMAAAVGFGITMPRRRWGRSMIVTGFAMWSLCFLSHPFIANQHPGWVPMVGEIWDLQKFFVTFGLLLGSIEESSAENEYNALHDELTGLPNRKLLRDRLEQGVARAKRAGTRVALFNMDLNGFKAVNDSLGHECGDELLREVARRLGTVKRDSDTLARVGGDEFLLLVNDLRANKGPGDGLMRQGESLKETFRRAAESGDWEYTTAGRTQRMAVSLSIGTAIYPDEVRNLEELLVLADERMYADKRGR